MNLPCVATFEGARKCTKSQSCSAFGPWISTRMSCLVDLKTHQAGDGYGSIRVSGQRLLAYIYEIPLYRFNFQYSLG